MKQHYLPECYLKEFCRNGELVVIDVYPFKNHGKKAFYEKGTPAMFARSKDFYTIKNDFCREFRGLKNRDPYELEELFHTYERKYSGIVSKIKARQKALTMDDAFQFAFALVDFKIRNAYFRNNSVADTQSKAVDSVIGEYALGIENADLSDYPGINKESIKKALVDVGDLLKDNSSIPAIHIWSQLMRKDEGSQLHQQIIDKLLQFRWIIYESKNNFLTNDNPGVSLDKFGVVQNTKFDSEVVYFMPITPSMCLVVDYKLRDDKIIRNKVQKCIEYKKVDKFVADKINEYHGFHINQHLFTNNESLAEEICIRINIG